MLGDSFRCLVGVGVLVPVDAISSFGVAVPCRVSIGVKGGDVGVRGGVDGISGVESMSGVEGETGDADEIGDTGVELRNEEDFRFPTPLL